AVIVGGVDGRKIQFNDQFVKTGCSHLLFRDDPVPVQPTAQRTEAARFQTIVFGERLVAARPPADDLRVDVEFLDQMLDETVPGGQPDAHRDSSTDEKDRLTLANGRGEVLYPFGLNGHRVSRRSVVASPNRRTCRTV